jgi:hypothetical protein
VHQVGNQPRLYYDARLTNHQDLIFRTDFRKYTRILNFIEIRPVSMRTDGRTDMTNLIDAFRNFSNAPDNREHTHTHEGYRSSLLHPQQNHRTKIQHERVKKSVSFSFCFSQKRRLALLLQVN